VALVGKGVTFDTGGLDLKRGAGMDGMKDDMAGAAAILGAVTAAAELELPTAVHRHPPPGREHARGAAMRPGDVVTARNGLTIEVTNTDAEGRLILADGLALAAEAGPDAILDLATLTGSVVYGLGNGCTGVFGNTPALTAEVLAAATRAGELACELPLIEDYRRFLDSEVADLVNSTNEPATASRRPCSCASSSPAPPGSTSTSPARPPPRRPATTSPRAAPAAWSGPCWPSWRRRPERRRLAVVSGEVVEVVEGLHGALPPGRCGDGGSCSGAASRLRPRGRFLVAGVQLGIGPLGGQGEV
jgi:hypothetical protein